MNMSTFTSLSLSMFARACQSWPFSLLYPLTPAIIINCPASASSANTLISSLSRGGAAKFKVPYHRSTLCLYITVLPCFFHPPAILPIPLLLTAPACLISSTAMASLRPIRRLPTPLIDSISYRSRASTRAFAHSCRMRATVGLDALDASKGDRERIVILGSGWAGELTMTPRTHFY